MSEEQLQEARNDLEALSEELAEQIANDMDTEEQTVIESTEAIETVELIEVMEDIKELQKANLYINTAIFGVVISSLAIITLLKGIFK